MTHSCERRKLCALANSPTYWSKVDSLFDYCTYPNCRRTTREGKPYCIEHLTLSPYIKSLTGLVERRESHIKCLLAGNLDLDPGVVEEIMSMIKTSGEATLQRVSFATGYTQRVISTYVQKLIAQGVLEEGRTPRGSVMVRICYSGPKPLGGEPKLPANPQPRPPVVLEPPAPAAGDPPVPPSLSGQPETPQASPSQPG